MQGDGGSAGESPGSGALVSIRCRGGRPWAAQEEPRARAEQGNGFSGSEARKQADLESSTFSGRPGMQAFSAVGSTSLLSLNP